MTHCSNKAVLQTLAALSLIIVIGCKPDTFRGTELPNTLPVIDFTLTDQHGQPFTMSRQKGNIVLLFFGYTYCPDVCPMTLSNWKRVHDALGADTTKVKFVYITVDPERDTQKKLAEHLRIFSRDFIGLTGTSDELNPVYDDYHIFHEKEKISGSATGYLVNHSARINLFDRSGHWRLSYQYNTPAEDIVHDIKRLLKSN